MASAEGQIWEVVGGADTGGLLVRQGKETSSKQEDLRLSTGALVVELELVGNRLSYKRLSGEGPETGWVSTSLKGKDLVIRTDKKPLESTTPAAAGGAAISGKKDPEVLTLADVRKDDPDPETWWHRFRKDGSSATKLEPPDPNAPKTGILSPIPRPNKKALPTLVDLPESVQARFRLREQTIYARMFCFYGVGDSAGQWMQFIDNAPSWCEVVVYECRAHGIRQKETWDRTYEERAEDIWENLLPAFQQHARGGEFEGAPFALYCHSGGTVPTALISLRLRAELALEPLAVYIADQRPPNMPFLNEAGVKLATEDPVHYTEVWNPEIGLQYTQGGRGAGARFILERWSIGLLMLEEWYRWCREAGPVSDGVRDTGVLHVFDCPLWLFLGWNFYVPPDDEGFDEKKTQATEEAMKEMTPERKALKEEYQQIKWKRPQGETALAELHSWDKWTTKEVTYIQVDAAHHTIWYHFDTEQPLWRSFIGLADIHSRMPKKKGKQSKRNY